MQRIDEDVRPGDKPVISYAPLMNTAPAGDPDGGNGVMCNTSQMQITFLTHTFRNVECNWYESRVMMANVNGIQSQCFDSCHVMLSI